MRRIVGKKRAEPPGEGRYCFSFKRNKRKQEDPWNSKSGNPVDWFNPGLLFAAEPNVM